MPDIEMVIHDVRASTISYQREVVLREKDGMRHLPIWVSPGQADAIAVSMQDPTPPKPMTHDFMWAAIDALGGSIHSVVIDKLKDDVFHAKAVVRTNEEQKLIDCRPCDALALAVRRGVAIYAAEDVLEEAGLVLEPE